MMEVIASDDETSDDCESDTSSENDDLEMLLLETFAPQKDLGTLLPFQDVSEDRFESLFRFKKNDFTRLVAALQLPDNYVCKQRTLCSGFEGLMILLRRLSYPNRWCDLVHLFGRKETELCLIFNEVLCDVYERFGHLLDQLDLAWIDPEFFSRAIYEKGAPLRNCWAFIDRTARPICRPVRNQHIMFSGHKRTHCLKFQSVVAPNGMICHLFGPLEGRGHDAFMLSVSGLLIKLQQKMTLPNGDVFVLYGDPAYPIGRHILAPFTGAHLSQAEQCFNADMSAVRTCVEWAYGKIIRYFAYLEFSKNLKVLLQPVAKLYKVAALLANSHTCLYGSQTGDFFNMHPPVLETYLDNH